MNELLLNSTFYNFCFTGFLTDFIFYQTHLIDCVVIGCVLAFTETLVEDFLRQMGMIMIH